MRGEDFIHNRIYTAYMGSPPHARGRPLLVLEHLAAVRITPACAGKTDGLDTLRMQNKDHPRMRGEDDVDPLVLDDEVRITPACAGKTRPCAQPCVHEGDHPRMRGEDPRMRPPVPGLLGSPPHARGRPTVKRFLPRVSGITPACAGKTHSLKNMHAHGQDHPRMRGEDILLRYLPRTGSGSPPHARGRPNTSFSSCTGSRITPACAGKTINVAGRPPHNRDHPRMRGEDLRMF